MSFKIESAKRKSVPMLISLASVSGGGKTFSSLLLAAGLAGPGGKVGFLDTENGRGSMYADSPLIRAALPQGYDIAEMREPFSPSRYTEAVTAFQEAGCKVLVIDSMTHEWEGYGGCADIAENNKLRGMPNWAKAKMEHKRMMNHLLAANMHIVFCLRARDKVAIVKDANGKEQIVPKGLTAIQEKNFIFEMTLSMLLDEKTHLPEITKCPEPLLPLFQGKQTLISKETGEKLREWAEAGAPVTALTLEDLFKQGLAYAAEGIGAYQDFWKTLTPTQQTTLLPKHEELKETGNMADRRKAQEVGVTISTGTSFGIEY